MTKRKSLIAVISFVSALLFALILGITPVNGLTAQAEGETPPADVTEYEITVYNGKATDSKGNKITKAAPGTEVTIIAEDWTSIGWAFVKWDTYRLIGTGEEIPFADANSATTTFIMPAREVGILAMQKKDVKAISADKKEITMSVGETAQITVTVEPKVLAIEVEYDFSNERKVVAFLKDKTDREAGKTVVTLIAKSVGTEIVTLSVGEMSVTCTVTVVHAQHEFATEWSKNETGHWHASTCGHDVKGDEAEHTYDEGTVTKPATEEEKGSKTFTCTVCGYEKTEEIEKLSHVHDLKAVGAIRPSCSAPGNMPYYECTTCHKKFDESNNEKTDEELAIAIDPDAHYLETKWTGVKDGHYHVCKNVGCPTGHDEIKAHTPDREEATETEPVKCTECDYTIKTTLSHVHDLTAVAEITATCSAKGTKAHYICNGCGHKFADEAGAEEIADESALVIPAAHKFGEWIEEVAATTETTGVKAHKTCEFCHKNFDEHDNEIKDLTIAKLPDGGDEPGGDEPSGEITENKGLSGGAIAGIVVGSVAVVGIGGFAIFWFAFKKKSFADLIAAIKGLFVKK